MKNEPFHRLFGMHPRDLMLMTLGGMCVLAAMLITFVPGMEVSQDSWGFVGKVFFVVAGLSLLCMCISAIRKVLRTTNDTYWDEMHPKKKA